MGLRNDVPNSPPRKTGNCSGTPTARKPTASYHGDLDFYFNGWDGRGRVHTIDTKKCPIYFLAGEYDWSNTPEMSEDTANKIAGARLKRMPDLDHFPATENPAVFVPYLLEAIDYVRASKAEC